MESLIPDGIRALAGQGGPGWILFCFAAALDFWFLKKLLEAKQTCSEQANALQEKRVEEGQRSVAVQHEVATALAELVSLIKERNLSSESLAQLVKQMARDLEANGLRWQDRVAGIERLLADISRRQEEHPRRSP